MQKGELWDIVDSERNFLRRSRRGNPIYSGEFHVNVSVWTISPDRRALLTLRAPDKPIYPNFWENTGGAALAGASSSWAATSTTPGA